VGSKKREKGRGVLWKIVYLVSALVFGAALVFLGIRLRQSIRDARAFQNNLTDQLRQNQATLDIITQSLSVLAGDSNDLRAKLGLSQREYPILTAMDSKEEEQNNEAVTHFQAVKKVYQSFRDERYLLAFNDFADSVAFQDFLKLYSFTTGRVEGYSLGLYRDKDRYFTLTFYPEEDEFSVMDSAGGASTRGGWDQAILPHIRDSLESMEVHFRDVREKAASMRSQLHEKELLDALGRKGLTVSNLLEDDERYTATVYHGNQAMFDFTLEKEDGLFTVGDQSTESPALFLALAAEAVDSLDVRSDWQKNLSRTVSDLLKVFADDDFLLLMESAGLSILPQPRENEYFILYDIVQGAEKIGSYAVNKYTSEIYLVDKDEVQMGSLRQMANIGPAAQKKK
jgi:hypothetical protein